MAPVKMVATQINLENKNLIDDMDVSEMIRKTERCSVKKVSLRISQNSQENTCARVSFLIKFFSINFIKKDTLAQVFSCKLCEISENTFSYRTPLVTASINVTAIFHKCLLKSVTRNAAHFNNHG